MQANRLPTGGRIDRTQAIEFSFNGQHLQGYAGDTLASALLANGISIVGRSFKYHRPRGIIGSGTEEPNAIMQTGSGATSMPNQRATQVELYDGLQARSINGWPSLNFDLLAINDLFSRMLGAGFYYKTFMQPGKFWKFYEHHIRKAAGLGISPRKPDPDHYAHHNAHCDVLIAGAGPSGLMAALAAGKSGARVIIADEQNELGGSLLHSSAYINGAPAQQWLSKILSELADCPEVTVLPRSTVFGYYDHNFLTILERCTDHLGEHQHTQIRQRLWRVRARQVILAQGAFERPIAFPNNDRPGVMLASSISIYVNRYAVSPGRRAVVFTNNDTAYQTALDLRRANIEVAAIVDSRHNGAGELADKARQAGIRILQGSVVGNVRGNRRVHGVQIADLSEDAASLKGTAQWIDCDLLAMSGGWNPAVHLHSQAGGKNSWSEQLNCFMPDQTLQANTSVGACNGSFELQACLDEGLQAGFDSAKQCGCETVFFPAPFATKIATHETQALWRVPTLNLPEYCPKQFIDFQNDTSVADIRLAVREGYHSVEHVKRYTGLGFGTDQGKLGNINGMAILAENLEQPIASVGTTTFRPAYTPVTFGAIAGETVAELFDPIRKTAIHHWHESVGAVFEVVGQWLRPRYFPKPGEGLDVAVARECLAVRHSLGIMDASTLGKIEVSGPDALTFLERIYTHNVAKLGIGRCAYGILLGEDGMVMDDGVMSCLGDQHYYLTTTTGGAATVLNWLEKWLQTEWPELRVYLTSTTDRWSTIALAGPNSRILLQSLDSDIDFENADFPFMTARSGNLLGHPVQVFRISFSGELAFEINIDSDHAAGMWQTLMTAGKPFDITPYGTETMHVLRAEKGFPIVGQDTDGSVTPVDLGMKWLLAREKDYLGKRSLNRSDIAKENRKQLVGLLCEDGETVLPEGTQLIELPEGKTPIPMLGHITSSYASACLGHPVALALLSSGRARKGEFVYAALRDGRNLKVKVVSPVFYDPEGKRQNV